MSTENEIVTSTGNVGVAENRSFGRRYLSDPQTYTNLDGFRAAYQTFVAENEKATPSRRQVFRTFVSYDVISALLQGEWGSHEPHLPGTRLEMVLELQQLTSKTESENLYLISVATNEHPSGLSFDELETGFSFFKDTASQEIHEPITNIKKLLPGYCLTRQVTMADQDDLLLLWGRTFGWSATQIITFINSCRNQENLWFCGVRDLEGKLVAACMAEAIQLGHRQFVELTEWASHTPGAATKMVAGLIAQVLERTYYQTSAQSQALPIIVAEMNLQRPPRRPGSPAAGVRAGLTFPVTQAVAIGGSENILRHNVLVDQGRLNDDEAVYRIPEQTLNNFIIGWLTLATVTEYYPPEAVMQIIRMMDSE